MTTQNSPTNLTAEEAATVLAYLDQFESNAMLETAIPKLRTLASYSPFARVEEFQRISDADAAYLRGEPLPLTISFPVEIDKPLSDDDYDPIRDEKKQYSISEWEVVAKKAITDFANMIRENKNESSQTWSYWMNVFIRWVSW